MADQRRVSEAAIRTWISQALVVHPRLYPRRIFGFFLCAQKETRRQAKPDRPGGQPWPPQNARAPVLAALSSAPILIPTQRTHIVDVLVQVIADAEQALKAQFIQRYFQAKKHQPKHCGILTQLQQRLLQIFILLSLQSGHLLSVWSYHTIVQRAFYSIYQ